MTPALSWKRRAHARGTVILDHGLLATSRFFEVARQESKSLAVWLDGLGFQVVSFDHRGAGQSRDLSRPGFGYQELVEDLGSVIAAVRAEGQGPLVLCGHSFGGTTIYGAVARARWERAEWLQDLRALITVASPARFRKRPQGSDWEDLYSDRSRRNIAHIVNKQGWVGLRGFTLAQAWLYRQHRWWDHVPLMLALLRPGIALGIALGKRSDAVAWLLQRPPLYQPTFLLNHGDTTAREFRDTLRGGILDRASPALIDQILCFGLRDQGEGGAPCLEQGGRPRDVTNALAELAVPHLCFASPEDQLVTAPEAFAVPDRPGVVRVLVGDTPAEACGHGGYFFKPRAWDRVRREASAFLEPLLPERGPQVLLLYNPRSGELRRRGAGPLLAEFRAALGERARWVAADDPTLPGRLRALDAERDVFAIAGGDGSLHHGIRALAEARGEDAPWPRLALVPVGSANDYAHALRDRGGVLPSIASLAEALATGRAPRPADLGRVRAPGLPTRWFVNFAGLGAPADWACLAESRGVQWLKATLGHGLAYLLCSLRVIQRNRALAATLALDGGADEAQRLFGLFLGKGRYLGDGMDLGSRAQLDSGRLVALLVPSLPRRALLGYLAKARKGQLPDPAVPQALRVTLAGPAVVNLDGEVVPLPVQGPVALTFDLLPGRLRWL